MNTVKTHRDLDVWKMSMDFALDLYRLTDGFPNEEKFGLVTQIRRAGFSICSNIAEGAARSHPKEFIQFLYHALGSASEIETQLEISCMLGYVTSIEFEMDRLKRIRQMLSALINAISRKVR